MNIYLLCFYFLCAFSHVLSLNPQIFTQCEVIFLSPIISMDVYDMQNKAVKDLPPTFELMMNIEGAHFTVVDGDNRVCTLTHTHTSTQHVQAPHTHTHTHTRANFMYKHRARALPNPYRRAYARTR